MKTVRQVFVLQKRCEAWNRRYPIGTRVTLLKDDGTRLATRTRSAAEVLISGHSAVVWLENVTGRYLLERCEPFTGETVPG